MVAFALRKSSLVASEDRLRCHASSLDESAGGLQSLDVGASTIGAAAEANAAAVPAGGAQPPRAALVGLAAAWVGS